MGRPVKFTPEVQAAFLRLLEDGMTRTAAAGECGVSYDTVSRLVASDAEFCGAVATAENAAEARMIRAALAGRGDKVPKADAWKWLERRKRHDWGSGQNVTVDGDHRVTIEVVRVGDG